MSLIINKDIHNDPEKVKEILNVQPPKNVSNILRFFSTVAWYRKVISNFSNMLAPMTNLIKKRCGWN